MPRIAVLFPGQGSQTIGMLNGLLARSAAARRLAEQADTILGYSLSKIIAQGPLSRLTATEYAQPALVLTSLCYWEVYRPQMADDNVNKVVAMAGHSIGEYAAMAAAEMFSFEQIMTLASLRGQLMADCAKEAPPGAMAVVAFPSGQQARIRGYLEEIIDPQVASIAAINGPTQIVIAGCLREIVRVEGLLSTNAHAAHASISSITRLPRVSCAFHSPLMRTASEAFYQAALPILRQARPARYPLINNVFAAEGRGGTGNLQSASNNINGSPPAPGPLSLPLPSLLKEHIVRPVLWHESLRTILSIYRPDGLLPMGPGTTLASLLRRDPQMAPLLLDNLSGQSEARAQ